MTDNEKAIWAKIETTQPVDDLIKHGPTIRAAILSTDDRLAETLALIDTGASGTAISLSIASRLELTPIGVGIIKELGREPISGPYFRVRLCLSPTHIIDTTVAGLALPSPHGVIIGRDILSSSSLSVDFHSGRISLHIR